MQVIPVEKANLLLERAVGDGLVPVNRSVIEVTVESETAAIAAATHGLVANENVASSSLVARLQKETAASSMRRLFLCRCWGAGGRRVIEIGRRVIEITRSASDLSRGQKRGGAENWSGNIATRAHPCSAQPIYLSRGQICRERGISITCLLLTPRRRPLQTARPGPRASRLTRADGTGPRPRWRRRPWGRPAAR